jgi:SAM-dependent methyltransferase
MSQPLDKSVAFDRAADYYDATRGYPPGVDAQIAAFIAQHAGLTPATRAVEIGVGTGRIAVPLAAHVGAYFGVDLAAPMLARLRAKDADGRVKIAQADIMALPVARQSFDCAVAVHILHLVPTPERAVAELARVLRPGGLVLLCNDEPDETALRPLRTAWGAVVETGDSGYNRWTRALEIFPAMDWAEAGHHILGFERVTTPHTFAERYRGRVFSSSWLVSDAVWRAGVEAVEAALAAHYPDPHAPVESSVNFNLRLYRRPA